MKKQKQHMFTSLGLSLVLLLALGCQQKPGDQGFYDPNQNSNTNRKTPLYLNSVDTTPAGRKRQNYNNFSGFQFSEVERQQCYNSCAQGDCPESCHPYIFDYLYSSFGPQTMSQFPANVNLSFATGTGALPNQLPGNTVVFPLQQYANTQFARDYMANFNRSYGGANIYSGVNTLCGGGVPNRVFGDITMNPCSAGNLNVMPGFATPMPSYAYFAMGNPTQASASLGGFYKKCVPIQRGVQGVFSQQRDYQAELDASKDRFNTRLQGLGPYWKARMNDLGTAGVGIVESLIDNATMRVMVGLNRANARINQSTAVASLYAYEAQQRAAIYGWYAASLGQGCNANNIQYSYDGNESEQYYMCCGCDVYSQSELDGMSEEK